MSIEAIERFAPDARSDDEIPQVARLQRAARAEHRTGHWTLFTPERELIAWVILAPLTGPGFLFFVFLFLFAGSTN